MFIKQISVFLTNKPGKINRLTDLLAENNIDIKAMTIADTQDFGIVRIITDNPDKTYEIIRSNNFTAKITDVFACEVPDIPGGLAKVLDEFKNSNASIEYLYSYIRMNGKNAVIIIKSNDAPPSGIKLLSEQELFAL